jgi:hypothetical protein
MRSFSVTRLDRRHKGYNKYSHYVTPVWSSTLADKLRYFEWRAWCWNTWGPGLEREAILQFGTHLTENPKWAWHVDTYSKRLYFASEKELNWFILTWSS